MEKVIDYPLADISYLPLCFELKAEEDARLPAFKGSLLRGTFGNALRRTVCVMGAKQACHTCMLNRQCINTQIFETLIFDDPPRFLKGLRDAPKPFILDCADERRDIPKGEYLRFELKLIGKTTDLHPFVIYAVKRMAERGLGYKRARFTLEKATFYDEKKGWQELYDGSTHQLLQVPNPLYTNHKHPKNIPDELSLEFITPTRIKIKEHYVMEFSFRELLFRILRRILELAHFYVPGAEVEWEFHDLLVTANHVEINNSKLHWIDLTRYSSRQKTEMQMGGFVGKLQLQGNLQPFLTILQTAEQLNIGKGTTFGMGKVRLNKMKNIYE